MEAHRNCRWSLAAQHMEKRKQPAAFLGVLFFKMGRETEGTDVKK